MSVYREINITELEKMLKNVLKEIKDNEDVRELLEVILDNLKPPPCLLSRKES